MFTMYDDVNLALVPKTAKAVAGYVGGRWPTYGQLAKLFPAAKHLSIAVNAEQDAECLDIERGDATNAQAPVWIRRQISRGVQRPVVYTSTSNARDLLDLLDASGIKRTDIRLWTAHYTGRPHLCDATCGFRLRTTADATQYTNNALGRSLDASLCSAGFLTEPLSVAARKQALRTWIFVKLAEEYSWAWIKKQPKYKLWRKLGGK